MYRFACVFAFVFAFLSDALLCAKQTRAEPAPVRLGAILPLTGNASFIGTGARIGIRAALYKINNEEGGVLGRKLEVVFEDTRSDQNLVVPLYRKLSENYDPPVVLTALTSAARLLQPIANEDQRLLFVQSSDPNLLSGQKKNEKGFTLRSFYTTDQSNDALISALKAKFLNVAAMEDKTLRLAILAMDEDWATAAADDLEKKLAGSRIETAGRYIISKDLLSGEQSTDIGKKSDKNPSPIELLLQKAKKQKPDAIVVVGVGQRLAPLYRSMKQMPPASEIYAFALCSDADLFSSAKETLEGIYSIGPRLDRRGPLYERLQKIYHEERPGQPVDMTSLAMFNATLILAEAIRSRAESPEQLREFILTQKEFDSAVGKLSFNPSGDAKWKATVELVKNGSCIKPEH